MESTQGLWTRYGRDKLVEHDFIFYNPNRRARCASRIIGYDARSVVAESLSTTIKYPAIYPNYEYFNHAETFLALPNHRLWAIFLWLRALFIRAVPKVYQH